MVEKGLAFLGYYNLAQNRLLVTKFRVEGPGPASHLPVVPHRRRRCRRKADVENVSGASPRNKPALPVPPTSKTD